MYLPKRCGIIVFMKLKQKSLLEFNKPKLESQLVGLGIKKFVTAQILDWIYQKYHTSFDTMSNLSKANKELLNKQFTILPFKKVESKESKDHFAKKYIVTLEDNSVIETVVIREKRYNTLCVSSQCGCPVDCKFCLTGISGFKRNLTVAEIVGQILLANQDGEQISRLVFMGMGEPLLNYDVVFDAIDILSSEYGFNIGKRKITVSTSGHLKLIQRLIDDKRFINLAFSVGHPSPDKRERVMPLEKHNPIMDVIKVLKRYQSMHNRKLTLEYTLLEDVNDTSDAISQLANLSKYLDAKINLINLNPHSKIPFKPVSSSRLLSIRDDLKKLNVPVTIRFRKGDDILAACGQLQGES